MPVSLKDPNHATEPASQHVSPTKSLTQATRKQTQRQGRLTSEEPGIRAKRPGPSPATLPVDAHPSLSLHGAFQSLLSPSSTGTAEGVAESLPCSAQVRLSSFSRLVTLGPQTLLFTPALSLLIPLQSPMATTTTHKLCRNLWPPSLNSPPGDRVSMTYGMLFGRKGTSCRD